VDSAGNVYVADTYNHTIRKITPAGSVTTLAGTAGSFGSADGTGSAARFYYPYAVAVDSVGNVYVADNGNDTIRKITPSGVVTTLAGTAGIYGSADGTGPAAMFDFPTSVAVDSAGNVYVADTVNETIRKITPTGIVTTLAGTAGTYGSADGTGPAAQFNDATAVAVDKAGNVYVADSGNNTIRKITPGGMVSTLAGTAGVFGSTDGTGPAAQFYNPSGVAVDSANNVYAADTGNNTIRKITPSGVVTTLAGVAGSFGSADGTGPAAQFDSPTGLAVNSAGMVYVADTDNDAIRTVTPGGVVATLAGAPSVFGSADGTGSAARFYNPSGVAVDSANNVYVADTFNQVIRKITPSGVVTTLAGTAGVTGSADGTGPAARFNYPAAVTVDSTGNLYVADTTNSTIRKITAGGVVTTLAGTAGVTGHANGTGSAAQFYYPFGVAVDSAGNVYVADNGNSTIRKITPGGVVTTLAGTAGSYGSADGTGPAAQFNYPQGVAVDSVGNVYVADTFNSEIRKITPGGVVTTLAGTAHSPGTADGTGPAARFNYPDGVTVDSAGNVYVADTINHTIREISPGGVVTTLAGTAGVAGSADGVGSAAGFNYPDGVAVDSVGNVYVADTGNSAIRKGVLAGLTTITWPQPSQITPGTALSATQLNATASAGGVNIPGTFTYTPAAGTVLNAGANQILSVTFTPANIVVYSPASTTTTITVASGSAAAASSSGGGAFSTWFLIALALLGLIRHTLWASQIRKGDF
jgi:sugar lactone lactonase YvrE